MGRPTKYFRAGVGAVIVDNRGLVLALERAGIPGAWQFPQGGLEADETPLLGVLREIGEETGIPKGRLKLADTYPELLVYELPRKAQSVKTGLGQVQRWFYFTLKKPMRGLPLPPNSEFRSASWMPFGDVVEGVVGFKKPVYEKLQAYFHQAFRQ
jgi:putative (di)nucleoside polyphosphate hydrolase